MAITAAEISEKEKERDLTLLHPRMMPKPLTKSKVYKLCNLGNIDPSTVSVETGRPRNNRNPFVLCEGYEEVFDKFEAKENPTKAQKTLKNVVGTTTEKKDGKLFQVEKIEEVLFRDGLFIVRPNQINTYIFMERSNSNKSNPFRDTTKPPVWEPLEDSKTTATILRDDDILLDAQLIAKEMTFDEARAYAVKLNIPVEGKQPEEIRWSLRGKAKDNPREFIRGSKDTRAMRKMQIGDALAYAIISFDADAKKWMWHDKKEICPVGIDKSASESLDEYFISGKDGAKAYQQMVEKLKSPEDFID